LHGGDEACAGAHFMARQPTALGHEVKLISPQFVRPFVKGNKNDFIDAEAIWEAASRPSMRFVSPKTEARQTLSVLHRMRDSLVRDRTKTANQAHGFLLEFGISLPKGLSLVRRLPSTLDEHELPPRLVVLLTRLHQHSRCLDGQIKAPDKEMTTQLEEDDLGSRLLTIPCVGPITASLLSAEMGDGKQYGGSRDFAASVGLVPRQHSTGGRANLLGISKRGRQVSAAAFSAVRPGLPAAPGASAGCLGPLGPLATAATPCEHGGARPGQQVLPSRLGVRRQPLGIRSRASRLRRLTRPFSCTTEHPSRFCDAEQPMT